MSNFRIKQMLNDRLYNLVKNNNFVIHDDLSIDFLKNKSVDLSQYHMPQKIVDLLLSSKDLTINVLEAASICINMARYDNLKLPKIINATILNLCNYIPDCSNDNLDLKPFLNETKSFILSNSNNVLYKLPKEFDGSIELININNLKIVDVPTNIKRCFISECIIDNEEFFSKLMECAKLTELSVRTCYSSNNFSHLTRNTVWGFFPIHLNPSNLDFYGVMNVLNFKNLSYYPFSRSNSVFNYPLFHIIEKHFDMYNRQEYIMDCALELIESDYENAVQI